MHGQQNIKKKNVKIVNAKQGNMCLGTAVYIKRVKWDNKLLIGVHVLSLLLRYFIIAIPVQMREVLLPCFRISTSGLLFHFRSLWWWDSCCPSECFYFRYIELVFPTRVSTFQKHNTKIMEREQHANVNIIKLSC